MWLFPLEQKKLIEFMFMIMLLLMNLMSLVGTKLYKFCYVPPVCKLMQIVHSENLNIFLINNICFIFLRC